MKEKSHIHGVIAAVIILLIGILAVGLFFAIWGKRQEPNSGGGDITFQNISNYNISYGDKAPTDTTRLWLKCAPPKKIELSDTISGTVTNEKIEKLDWELDIGNYAYAGAVVGTDLFIFTREKGVIKVDLLTGENSQVSKTNTEYKDNAVTAIPYGQYIYIGYITSRLSNGWYNMTLYVKKFNTVNNEFIGSWTKGLGESNNPDYILNGFIFNDQFYMKLEYDSYVFDLTTCKYVTASDTVFKSFPYSNVKYEIFNGKCYSFQTSKIVKSDLKNNFEKEEVTSTVSSYWDFTPKGIGTNIYLFGRAGSLNGNAIQRYNTVSNSLETLDILMCAKREIPIVAPLGASFYILGGYTSGTDYNICEKFTVDFELEQGKLVLTTNGKKVNEIALYKGDDGTDVIASVSSAYIGNSKGKGESVEVYLYDDELSDWRLIAA